MYGVCGGEGRDLLAFGGAKEKREAEEEPSYVTIKCF